MLDSLSIAGKDIHFLVNKSERIFQVLGKGMVLKEYPCVLGEVPDGDKMMQGDRRTPEGTFHPK
ncbi:MAG: L,D-transpeptidase family protein [Flavobacteriales bacterium]|nr:L,D-transpeptidase family protein [Flavobacteriales bacterium]